jgi:hypothetical protein
MPVPEEYTALMAAATNAGPVEEGGLTYLSNPGWVNTEPRGMNVVTPGGTLFFAASGHLYDGGSSAYRGVDGYYWTSTIAPVEDEARHCGFFFRDYDVHTWTRTNGDLYQKSVRCVAAE